LVGDSYEILGQIGHGGTGVVYRAYDRSHKRLVALKTVHAPDTQALHRLKNDFRARANLTHPNLVNLYEMVGVGEHAFFTMELVNGRNLVDYVREGAGAAEQETVHQAADNTDDSRPRPAVPLRPEQIDRMRQVFGQLAKGVLFLHDAGILHRDIKPSN